MRDWSHYKISILFELCLCWRIQAPGLTADMDTLIKACEYFITTNKVQSSENVLLVNTNYLVNIFFLGEHAAGNSCDNFTGVDKRNMTHSNFLIQ